MKKTIKGLIFLTIGFLFSAGVIAQPPGRPPTGGTGIGYAGNQNPIGPVGAPIEPGTGVMLLLGLGYGISKIYSIRQQKTENLES